MTIEEIVAEVAKIAAMTDDPEIAHGWEDDLHISVLQAIAAGECDDPAGFAAAALKTIEIRYTRWYA